LEAHKEGSRAAKGESMEWSERAPNTFFLIFLLNPDETHSSKAESMKIRFGICLFEEIPSKKEKSAPAHFNLFFFHSLSVCFLLSFCLSIKRKEFCQGEVVKIVDVHKVMAFHCIRDFSASSYPNELDGDIFPKSLFPAT
jgi:hypothetical protein